MARLYVKGYLVNDTIHPEYEIGAQDLIDKFIGGETGAPIRSASLILETDDGYWVRIDIPIERSTGQSATAREIHATVRGSAERVKWPPP